MKIFISGASSGLGLSLAKAFILQGDTVLGVGRRKFELDGNEAGLKNKFKYVQCDTTDFLQVKNTFARLKIEDFQPDIAIFCAGGATEDIFNEEFNAEKLKENFSLNLFGAMYWIELFLPQFLKKSSGIFAYISSQSIYRENHKNRIGYSASKLAVNKAFENLRMQYYKQQVSFTVFNMGRIGKKKGLIGTSYDEAACKIVKILKSKNIPSEFNIPLFQYLLTRLTAYIPASIYHKFIFK